LLRQSFEQSKLAVLVSGYLAFVAGEFVLLYRTAKGNSMKTKISTYVAMGLSLVVFAWTTSPVLALQPSEVTAYSASSDGTLYETPFASGISAVVGNLGFTPSAIDFEPTANILYAIKVGPATTQLYQINTTNATSTPVGVGFASSGTFDGNAYDLTNAAAVGFDFDPTSLQPDSSMRIRLTTNTGANLQLNSATGLISSVDTTLHYASSTTPGVGDIAYSNNIAQTGGTTTVIDYRLTRG
jgi:hypothetical protein